jgi:error-prone DNA polymerase
MSTYIELHAHSYYSLLDGVSSPRALVARAAHLGMPALALTDHNAVYGVMPFVRAAREAGIQPILGAELTLDDGSHLTLLVRDGEGWANLCALITLAHANAPKGQAALPEAALERHTAGLIALSGCRGGQIARAVAARRFKQAQAVAERYHGWFGRENFVIELQHHKLPNDDKINARLVELATSLGLAYVATNNVHYATRDLHDVQDVVTCIRTHTTLATSHGLRRPNSEYALKSAGEMGELFARYPQALATSLRIAERCQFTPQFGVQDLPAQATPDGQSAMDYLRDRCRAALASSSKLEAGMDEKPVNGLGKADTARSRASQSVLAWGSKPHAELRRYHEQLEHELRVIAQAGLGNYFLVVADIVDFARRSGIRCQGRGSAANSLVAYLLGISPVDPLTHKLVFERFLSQERVSVPDIDIDFDAARREEVIQYIYEKHGREHAAMACTFVTYRRRSSVRDVGKALGLAPHLIENAVAAIELDRPLPADTPYARELARLSETLKGHPRHLGIHNGGMVLTHQPLSTILPTEPATMPGRTVVQWDKEGLEDAQMVKIDILGLRMLSAIDEAVRWVEEIEETLNPQPLLPQGEGEPEDSRTTSVLMERNFDVARPASTPLSQVYSPFGRGVGGEGAFNDPAVYAMLQKADTIGVFQVESRAQAQTLPRLKPKHFNDVIVSISLIRPGPIQGNMVHPYLRRRRGQEPVRYPHPRLEAALEETLGVILFQEQVLKVARDLAGFTAGEGELLRRALGAKHAEAQIEALREQFVAGAVAGDVLESVAQSVFDSLTAFGGYSFPKSHAAAFAVLVYQSAYLKLYHPHAFTTALLNHQPMGFWTPAVLVNDARRHGIDVRGIDINRSGTRCTVEDSAIRLGFSYVQGIGERVGAQIEAARGEQPFRDLADLLRRIDLPPRLLERLILVGACDAWGDNRRQLLWQAQTMLRHNALGMHFADEVIAFKPLTALEKFAFEASFVGIATGEHIMNFYRPWMKARGICTSRELARVRSGARVEVAGETVMHQAPPTAKGFHFLTLEDEGGMMNIIVRPKVYERYKPVLRHAPVLWVSGTVERDDGVVNVLCDKASSVPGV